MITISKQPQRNEGEINIREGYLLVDGQPPSMGPYTIHDLLLAQVRLCKKIAVAVEQHYDEMPEDALNEIQQNLSSLVVLLASASGRKIEEVQ